MSDENVQVVRRLYDAMARADMEGVLALMSADVEFVVPGPPQIDVAGTWRGHAGVRECFQRLRAFQQNERLEVREFVADRDHVVVLLHVAARVLATGKIFESDIVHFFTLRNGVIVKLFDFLDTAAVVDATRA